MSKLQIGWSEISITPDKPASLAGQFAERISQYIEKPLTATALAIEAGDEQLVLVNADILVISYNLTEALKEKLAGNALGLDPTKVIWSAAHCHTAPYYNRINRNTKFGGATTPKMLMESQLPPGRRYVETVTTQRSDIITNDEMLQLLTDRLAQVTLEAWANRKPGGYSNAFGRAVVGHCRRATYLDGTAQMWGNTNTAEFHALEAGSDTGVELLYVFDEAKKLTGIVANLACPAQCVQHRLFISPDFWGEAKKLLRERFGEDIFLLPLCSAAGDQCPVDLVRWVEPESDLNDPNCTRVNPPKRKADPSMFDLAGMRKVGRRIAREIIDVFEEGLEEAQYDVPMIHKSLMLQLPLRRVTAEEVANAKAAIARYFEEHPGDMHFSDAANLQVHIGILQRSDLQEKMPILDTEVHIVRLGNIAFASNPFELFLDYGNKLKACSPAEQTFLVQLANGAEGYLPTEKAEQGGHYSAFVSSGLVGHEGGNQLVDDTLAHIKELF